MTTPVREPKTGKFRPTVGSHIDSKGYLVLTCGSHRKVRLHRLLGAFKMGRPLTKDEDVHHKNGNKLDMGEFGSNLKPLGHAEHGAVSNKQRMFLKQKFEREKAEWEDHFGEELEAWASTTHATP